MTAYKDFSAEKQRLLNQLRTLHEQLAAAEKATEVDLLDLQQKVTHAIEGVSAEQFSIALFGAFSDGKTTLAGALVGRSDLKIGPEPTTDEITELSCGDYTIVDTPGLFPVGLMHDERTRKYISEANLILFVLPPQNPLKESHREVVKWLLDHLGKLPATVFVVNKMDEVADVDDDGEFQESAAVRREVVVETVARYVGKTVSAMVVCVAADPRQKGLAHWLEHPDEYEQLSRMDELRRLTDRIMREARRTLILRAGFDVLREAQGEARLRIGEALRAIDEQLRLTENAEREVAEEIEELEEESRLTWVGLMKEFENERKRLVVGIDARADARSLATYVMAEIGKEGDELLRRVDRLITDHAEPLAGNAQRKMENIDTAVGFQQGARTKVFKAVGKVSGRLGQWLVRQSTRGLADAVLNMNRAWKLTKFKPWGAVKLAGKIKVFGKILVILGPILDILGPVMDMWTEHKLNNKKAELTGAIDDFFRELRDQLTLVNLRAECCPGMEESRQVRGSLGKEREDYRIVLDKLRDAERVIEELKFGEG
jgi:GTPase SAR1 family protein